MDKSRKNKTKNVKSRHKNESKVVNNTSDIKHDRNDDNDLDSRPIPSTLFRRFAKRLFLIGLALCIGYFFHNKKQLDIDGYVAFVRSDGFVKRRAYEVSCSNDYDKEKGQFDDCLPKRCGRVVTDGIVSNEDADAMLRIAMKGFAFGGSNGGASILDINSGALSKGDDFVNIFRLPEAKDVFTYKDFKVFSNIKNKILMQIGMEFGAKPHTLFLTSPTFFSKMTTKPAKTIHDEYWHPHVDKETYETFHYTSLLYLGTYGEDFKGGRFVFLDKDVNRTVEPRKGYNNSLENLLVANNLLEARIVGKYAKSIFQDNNFAVIFYFEMCGRFRNTLDATQEAGYVLRHLTCQK